MGANRVGGRLETGGGLGKNRPPFGAPFSCAGNDLRQHMMQGHAHNLLRYQRPLRVDSRDDGSDGWFVLVSS